MRNIKLIILTLLIIVHAPLLAVDSFNYVGNEYLHPIDELKETHPPINNKLLGLLNKTNIASILNSSIGNLYTSHGCIHITPTISLALYHFLPVDTPVVIQPYSKTITAELRKIPDITNLMNSKSEYFALQQKFKGAKKLRFEVYPRQGGIIYIEDKPFASLDILSGPHIPNRPLQEYGKNTLVFDRNQATPTPEGTFRIARKTDFFYAPLYPYTSRLKQGTEIEKRNGTYYYLDHRNNSWQVLPEELLQDIQKSKGDQELTFYDIEVDEKNQITKAKWGGHPFGTYAMLLKDKNHRITSILIHTNGELILEQKELLYYLSEMLSVRRSESWDDFVNSNKALLGMKIITDFTNNPNSDDYEANESLAFYKLANNIPLKDKEKELIAPFYFPAQKNIDNIINGKPLSLSPADKEVLNQYGYNKNINLSQFLYGIHEDIMNYDVSIKKSAHWYNSLKKSWEKLTPLKAELDTYFDKHNIHTPIQRKRISYALLSARLKYDTVSSLDLWPTLSEFN